MLAPLLATIQRRIVASALTLPSCSGWLGVAAVLAGTAAVVLPLGLSTGFLHVQVIHDHALVAKGCLLALVSPALLEEALFRGALLPHPRVDPVPAWATPGAFALRSAAPLAAYVLHHLLNPRPESRAVFSNTSFLGLAGVLGAACSVAYWTTGGSLAAAVVVHWLPVCVWLFGLGGYGKLRYGDVADISASAL